MSRLRHLLLFALLRGRAVAQDCSTPAVLFEQAEYTGSDAEP